MAVESTKSTLPAARSTLLRLRPCWILGNFVSACFQHAASWYSHRQFVSIVCGTANRGRNSAPIYWLNVTMKKICEDIFVWFCFAFSNLFYFPQLSCFLVLDRWRGAWFTLRAVLAYTSSRARCCRDSTACNCNYILNVVDFQPESTCASGLLFGRPLESRCGSSKACKRQFRRFFGLKSKYNHCVDVFARFTRSTPRFQWHSIDSMELRREWLAIYWQVRANINRWAL